MLAEVRYEDMWGSVAYLGHPRTGIGSLSVPCVRGGGDMGTEGLGSVNLDLERSASLVE